MDCQCFTDRDPYTLISGTLYGKPQQRIVGMTAKSINVIDRVFLAGESRESMMHVGALMQFSAQRPAPENFLRELMDEVKASLDVKVPWNLKLRYPFFLNHPLQCWIEDEHFDVEYHVRRSALPHPGDEKELGILVSRLHSHHIDQHRPPWEVHFIEGLENDRFAIYFKVHHSLVDGYTGIKLLTHTMSKSVDELDTPLFYLQEPFKRTPREDGMPARQETPSLDGLFAVLQEQLHASRDAGHAFMNVVRSFKARDDLLIAPMQAPKSIINQAISRNRRFATQIMSIERLKKVASQYHGTLNDVVLAVCASALRQLMLEQNALPDEPLVAMLPVNIRPKDDIGGGNAIGTILASLGTHLADPVERIRHIIASTTHAKEQLSTLSRAAIVQFSAMLMSPMLLSQVPGLPGKVRPAFNVVISNVPGPTMPLYFRGYKMDSYFPLSIPMHGYGLNITVMSYLDTLNFGFIGCRDSIPHLQRLAVYSLEALEDLEQRAAST